jgi:hypothetical protein
LDRESQRRVDKPVLDKHRLQTALHLAFDRDLNKLGRTALKQAGYTVVGSGRLDRLNTAALKEGHTGWENLKPRRDRSEMDRRTQIPVVAMHRSGAIALHRAVFDKQADERYDQSPVLWAQA